MRRRPILTRGEKRLLTLMLDDGVPTFPLIAGLLSRLERRGLAVAEDGEYFTTELGRAALLREAGQLN